MIIHKGKYNEAIIMVDDLDQETISQIYSFLNHPAFAKGHIAIMADAHAGAGSCIGFTMKMNEYVIPNVVGVDIGCGVLAINLGYPLFEGKKDFEHLDHFIKQNIPSGFNIRSVSDRMPNNKKPEDMFDKKLLREIREVVKTTRQDIQRVKGSVGTLGGGNHFIEVDHCEETGMDWLLVHSGSRNFGLRVANHYQSKAKDLLKKLFVGSDAYKGLEYLPLDMGGDEYIEAMKVAQDFASLNRRLMANLIIQWISGNSPIGELETIETIHNYINFDDNIIRKGAVSAQRGERLVIPFNMRDGTAVCIGKGSSKWNYSAPHGAGRLLSRRKAKEQLVLKEFQDAMEGIYTTTATQNTLDEAPMAYKDMDYVVKAIGETVDIDFFMKPVYNFKAGGESERKV